MNWPTWLPGNRATRMTWNKPRYLHRCFGIIQSCRSNCLKQCCQNESAGMAARATTRIDPALCRTAPHGDQPAVFVLCQKIELVFRGPGSIPVHKPCAAGFGLLGGRRPAGKKHLLKRTPHHTDRRAFLIELTPEGEACFKEHHEFHLKMTRKIVSGLTASEQKTFADVIEKILKKI